MTRILLLAGTAEARALAARLKEVPGVELTASLAGVTSDPEAYACETRTGGFGGAEGLARWMSDHQIDLLLDATHPFAARMQANAVAAADICVVARIRLLRPPWPARPGWVTVRDLDEAAARLPKNSRVFLATGRKEFDAARTRTDCKFWLRSIEAVGDLPAHITSIVQRPPYDLESERDLMRRHCFTHLVTKNSGGESGAKLEAAEQEGLTVIVVARPTLPQCPVVETVDEVVEWVRAQLEY